MSPLFAGEKAGPWQRGCANCLSNGFLQKQLNCHFPLNFTNAALTPEQEHLPCEDIKALEEDLKDLLKSSFEDLKEGESQLSTKPKRGPFLVGLNFNLQM